MYTELDIITVKDLQSILTTLIEEGKGDYLIKMDVEGMYYDKIDYLNIVDIEKEVRII